MAQDLRIITTGGTFDKQYDAVKGELTFRESQLPRILGQARCTLTVHLEGPLAVDSLYMTEEQRGETARVIAKKDIDKTIVSTGAITPYSLEGSDAVFNLDSAISTVQLLEPGVYITMSGRTFPWDNCQKDPNKGIFISIR